MNRQAFPVIAGNRVIRRIQTYQEEFANALSHGVAMLGAVAALPVLIIGTMQDGGMAVVGASVFGTTLLLLYLASMIYHALPAGRYKNIFLIVDHCAIYLLIAGTYTPFTLGILRGVWGWTLFGIVWGLALAGIFLKTVFGTRYPKFSISLYLAMGWIVVIAAQPMLESMPLPGLLWLLGGGMAYTLGVIFFLMDNRLRFAHFIWHLFVVTGSSCHFVAVLRYASA